MRGMTFCVRRRGAMFRRNARQEIEILVVVRVFFFFFFVGWSLIFFKSVDVVVRSPRRLSRRCFRQNLLLCRFFFLFSANSSERALHRSGVTVLRMLPPSTPLPTVPVT